MRFWLATASLFATMTTTPARAAVSSSPSTPNTSQTAAAFVVNNMGSVHDVVTDAAAASRKSSTTKTNMAVTVDTEYPGTAVERMHAVRDRVRSLSAEDLNGPWQEVRRKLLWAGGLRDLPKARPGHGYTGHSFNDYNHVDLTCMAERVSDNENDGSVEGIALGNQLGSGIRIASLPELGPGGSWSTCAIGCAKNPPQDVAHVQFRSRIAFKLVWVPNKEFDMFVLVDDDGKELARGKPSDGPAGGGLPALRQRQVNYQIVSGSKYSRVADLLANNITEAEE